MMYCFNTPGRIKVLVAFCFCVNMSNLIYLFIRYHDILPPDGKRIKKSIESVMPDVKNLDKYMTPKDGTVFLSSLAAISVVFDYILYAGVEEQQPALILSAWLWGIVDCSLDAAIGVASANMSIMDGLAREADLVITTEPVEPSVYLYRKKYGSSPTPTTPKPSTIHEPPLSNDTEYILGRKKQVVDYQEAVGDTDPYRLTPEQTAVLVVYVIFRLLFKMMALVGIKDYASYVVAQRQKRQLEKVLDYDAEEASFKTTTAVESHAALGSQVSVQSVVLPPELPPEPLPPPNLPPYPAENSMAFPHVP